jgi:hypothetical protein
MDIKHTSTYITINLKDSKVHDKTESDSYRANPKGPPGVHPNSFSEVGLLDAPENTDVISRRFPPLVR